MHSAYKAIQFIFFAKHNKNCFQNKHTKLALVCLMIGRNLHKRKHMQKKTIYWPSNQFRITRLLDKYQFTVLYIITLENSLTLLMTTDCHSFIIYALAVVSVVIYICKFKNRQFDEIIFSMFIRNQFKKKIFIDINHE